MLQYTSRFLVMIYSDSNQTACIPELLAQEPPHGISHCSKNKEAVRRIRSPVARTHGFLRVQQNAISLPGSSKAACGRSLAKIPKEWVSQNECDLFSVTGRDVNLVRFQKQDSLRQSLQHGFQSCLSLAVNQPSSPNAGFVQS